MLQKKDLSAVAFLGWADIAAGAAEGGGYNLVAQQHALGVRSGGAETYHLQSGTKYGLSWLFSVPGTPRIRFVRRWKGIRCFSLINSSNRAPAVFNHANTVTQIDDPKQNDLVIQWLLKMDIGRVVIHSLEGQALSLVREIKQRTPVRVEVMCHDHFYLCSQVQLLYRNAEPCVDYRLGEKCETCVPPDLSASFNKRQALKYAILKSGIPPAVMFLKHLVKRKHGSRTHYALPGGSPPPVLKNAHEDFLGALRPDASGLFYAQRRRASLEALRLSDAVFCPSTFIADSLAACGLPGMNVRIVRLGLPHLDRLMDARGESGELNRRITFCYRGTGRYHKGLSFFLEALLQLPPAVLEACRFVVRGVENDGWMRTYSERIPHLAIHPAYGVDDLPGFADEYDIGVLPHLWFENSPITLLEHFASGKPVLAARMGGVVDYVREGENGWFFEAGNGDDLARKISGIAAGTMPVPVLDANQVARYGEFLKTVDSV